MGKLQKVITTTLLAFTLMVSGCSSDNGVDTSSDSTTGGYTSSIAVVDGNSSIAYLSLDSSAQNLEVTENSETRSIILKVFDAANAPVQSGSLKVIYPSETVTSGVDVGSMNPSIEANVTDGTATFIYTAPSDLKALTSNGVTGTQYSFFDSKNPALLVALPIKYSPNPDAIDNTKYEIEVINAAGTSSINLESKVPVTITVKEAGGDVLENNDIISAKITTLNSNIATLIDNNIESHSVEYSTTNPKTINLQTFTRSGLVTLKIEMTILDKNGVSFDIIETIGLTVLSGPATAISISYVSTGQEKENAQFIETFGVKLTDKYDNPVNTNPRINVGSMIGYAKENSITASGNLFASPTAANLPARGTISKEGEASKLDVTGGYDLSQIDLNNDFLVTFGIDYSYHASGKWDIDTVGPTSLLLKDSFNTESVVPNMAFAVGHNFRQDRCRFGREWLATVDSADGTYKVDDSGFAQVKMSYDYYMVGKNIMMYVNLVGTVNSENKKIRVGESIKHLLRGKGLFSVPESYTIPEGANGLIVVFDMQITDTVEWYRNANFSAPPEITGDVTCTEVQRLAYQSCDNGGVAYVIYSCSAIEGGSISLPAALPSTEFN